MGVVAADLAEAGHGQAPCVSTSTSTVRSRWAFAGIRIEPGRVPAQLDHDAVRIHEVQRVAPAVVLFHGGLDALGGHPGAYRLLLLGGGPECTMVDPERQPDPLAHVAGPVGGFPDLVELEEGDALGLAVARRTDVVEHVADPALAECLQLGVDEREPHQVLVEVRGGFDIAGGVGDMVQRHAASVDPTRDERTHRLSARSLLAAGLG